MDAKTTVISAPVVPPILTAIQQNVESKLWSVNCKGAEIYVMSDGVYMSVRDAVGADIRATAYAAGHTNVPKNIDEIVQILRDAGAIVLPPVTEDGVVEVTWSIQPEVEEKPILCVKFDSAERVFPNGNAPSAVRSAVALKDDKPTERNEQPEGKHTTIGCPTRPAPIPKPLRLSERKGVSEPAVETLSDSEISEKISVPLSPEDCQLFLRRLIARIISELKNGGGAVTGSVAKSGGELSCSSLTVEQVLENHGISKTTFVSFLRMNGSVTRLKFDTEAHRVKLKN